MLRRSAAALLVAGAVLAGAAPAVADEPAPVPDFVVRQAVVVAEAYWLGTTGEQLTCEPTFRWEKPPVDVVGTTWAAWARPGTCEGWLNPGWFWYADPKVGGTWTDAWQDLCEAVTHEVRHMFGHGEEDHSGPFEVMHPDHRRGVVPGCRPARRGKLTERLPRKKRQHLRYWTRR